MVIEVTTNGKTFLYTNVMFISFKYAMKAKIK